MSFYLSASIWRCLLRDERHLYLDTAAGAYRPNDSIPLVALCTLCGSGRGANAGCELFPWLPAPLSLPSKNCVIIRCFGQRRNGAAVHKSVRLTVSRASSQFASFSVSRPFRAPHYRRCGYFSAVKFFKQRWSFGVLKAGMKVKWMHGFFI